MTPITFRYDRDPAYAQDPVFAIFPQLKTGKNDGVFYYRRSEEYKTGELQALIDKSRPATPQEALPLLQIIKKIGYKDLVITKKI